jgi:hypothetical protein
MSINVIQQPTTWIGAYMPNLFRFNVSITTGAAWSGGTFPGGTITLSTGTSPLPPEVKVGDIIEFTFSSFNYVAAITSIDNTRQLIGANSLTPTTPSSLPVNVALVIKINNPLTCEIHAGKLGINQPLVKRVEFKAIPRNGEFNVELKGYIQDLFANIQRPPVVGVDAELFTQYQLRLKFGNLTYLVGTVKNSVYSTTQSTGTGTQFLQVQPISTYNNLQSIYSFTLGNRVITQLI